jgi:hypothetical protein
MAATIYYSISELCSLNPFEDPRRLGDQNASLDLSIRFLAFRIRSLIFLKHITVTLNKMGVYFNQSFLDTYVEKL